MPRKQRKLHQDERSVTNSIRKFYDRINSETTPRRRDIRAHTNLLFPTHEQRRIHDKPAKNGIKSQDYKVDAQAPRTRGALLEA